MIQDSKNELTRHFPTLEFNKNYFKATSPRIIIIIIPLPAGVARIAIAAYKSRGAASKAKVLITGAKGQYAHAVCLQPGGTGAYSPEPAVAR